MAPWGAVLLTCLVVVALTAGIDYCERMVSTPAPCPACAACVPQPAAPAPARDAGISRACVVGGHLRDYDHFERLLRSGEPFALARYGDGERALIRGEGVPKQSQAFAEDRFWSPPGETEVGRDLLASLKGHRGEAYYLGFASPLDDSEGLQWFLGQAEQDCEHITYANLFVNAFYARTKALLQELLPGAVLVANHEAIARFRALGGALSMELPDDAPHAWRGARRDAMIAEAERLARSVERRLFVVSGGPLAKSLIACMWRANPRNQYVDFGSSTDELLKGRITRPYMRPDTVYARQVDPAWIASQGERPRIFP